MYPYMNEEVAWQRVKDLQREVENSRWMSAGQPGAAIAAGRRLAARAWSLAGLALGRPPRRHPSVVADAVSDERESEVA